MLYNSVLISLKNDTFFFFWHQQKIWENLATSFFMVLLETIKTCDCLWVHRWKSEDAECLSLLVFALYARERSLMDFMLPDFTPSSGMTTTCVHACCEILDPSSDPHERPCTLNRPQYLHSFVFTFKGGLLWSYFRTVVKKKDDKGIWNKVKMRQSS